MPKNARVRSNRICFTLNNYTEEEAVSLTNKVTFYHNDGYVKFAVIGCEKGESGTPHLQGFLHLDDKPKNCGIKFWREHFGELSRAHLENARGSDGDNDEYCTKDGDFYRVGDPVENSCHFTKIWEASKTGVEAIAEVDMEFATKHFFQARALAEYHKQTIVGEPLTIDLRDWQRRALELLEQQTDRQILFVVDEEGGKGKTVLASYLSRNLKAYRCGGGKHTDLAYMWSTADRSNGTVAIDLTRTLDAQYYPYHFMEDLKNGFMTSTKYTSKSFEFPPQRVIVFTNQYPDKTKLSLDRYQIYKI